MACRQADQEHPVLPRPGPCPALVNCEDYQLGKKLPASRYLAPDYQDMDAIEPAMGNHLIDPTGPDFKR